MEIDWQCLGILSNIDYYRYVRLLSLSISLLWKRMIVINRHKFQYWYYNIDLKAPFYNVSFKKIGKATPLHNYCWENATEKRFSELLYNLQFHILYLLKLANINKFEINFGTLSLVSVTHHMCSCKLITWRVFSCR